MRDLAMITKIQDISPIEGKDRIELATVENYPVIVQKGEYKVGGLVVYVFYDTVLPQKPEFEFLRARCWSELYQGMRIKNMKMAGVFSSGIIFPLSILPLNTKIKEGAGVAYELGVVKYNPEEMKEKKIPTKHSKLYKYFMRFYWFRLLTRKKKPQRTYPITVSKSDEVNIEAIYNYLQEKHPVAKYYVTEKMEGQAFTGMLYGKRRKYLIFSHNTIRDGNGNWGKVSTKYGIEKELRKEKENYAIQGEICGPGIQRNVYSFTELKLFVYKVTNTKTGEALGYRRLRLFCDKHNLTFVPILKEDVVLPTTLDETIKSATGFSVYGTKVLREGLVWRSVTDQHVGFKSKSREYAMWFEKGNKTE